MKRIIQQISNLFMRKHPEIVYGDLEAFDGPLFDVGQRVLVINPNMIDPPEEPPEIGIIHEIAYLPEIDEYVYKLDGSSLYYNENWLQEDVYGPKHYFVKLANAGRKREKRDNVDNIDNMLEIYEWNKRMWLRTGDESYREKLAMLEEELRKLSGR